MVTAVKKAERWAINKPDPDGMEAVILTSE